MARYSWIVFACLLAVAACGGAAEDGKTLSPQSTCDPFVVATEPTTLQSVAAAGRAADGRIYVVDGSVNQPPSLRVFAVEGGVLRSFPVLGGGGHESMQQIDVDGLGTIVLTSPASLSGERWNAMAVGGETLAPLTDAELAGFAVENTYVPRVIYELHTGDNWLMLITRAAPASRDPRVFYGPETGMRERVARSIVYDATGGVSVTFDVDGADTTTMLGSDRRVLRAAGAVTSYRFSCL